MITSFSFLLFPCLSFLSGKTHKICGAVCVVLTLELKRRANFPPVGVVCRYSIIAWHPGSNAELYGPIISARLWTPPPPLPPPFLFYSEAEANVALSVNTAAQSGSFRGGEGLAVFIQPRIQHMAPPTRTPAILNALNRRAWCETGRREQQQQQQQQLALFFFFSVFFAETRT